MAEPIIILDTNVLKDISRGNKAMADALSRYVKSGTPVYISRAAYDELVTRAETPQMGANIVKCSKICGFKSRHQEPWPIGLIYSLTISSRRLARTSRDN